MAFLKIRKTLILLITRAWLHTLRFWWVWVEVLLVVVCLLWGALFACFFFPHSYTLGVESRIPGKAHVSLNMLLISRWF